LTIFPSDGPELHAHYDDFSTVFTVLTVVPAEEQCTQVPKTVGLLFKNACTIIFTNILHFNITVLYKHNHIRSNFTSGSTL
jgi:hypothetical protein